MRCSHQTAPMTHTSHRDLLRILRATLSLLKAAEYPDRGNPQTEKVANCLREAILELEISTHTTNDGNQAASSIAALFNAQRYKSELNWIGVHKASESEPSLTRSLHPNHCASLLLQTVREQFEQQGTQTSLRGCNEVWRAVRSL